MSMQTRQKEGLLFKSGMIDVQGHTLRGGRREVMTAINAIVDGAAGSD